MLDVIEQLRDTVGKWEMMPAGLAPVVLMVSGGADSVAMTRLLLEVYPDNNYTILHINHGLRGKAADADEAFVRNLANELGLAYQCRCFNLENIQATQGGNLEELGRDLRYGAAHELLAELETAQSATEQNQQADQNQADNPPASGRIFTAHSADDRVETFLMRVIKGAGTTALSSIPYTRGKLARPLLDCERGDLRRWLTEHGYQWCEDETNYDTNYLRANLRHVIVPLMQNQNPRLTSAVSRSLEILNAEDAFIEQSLDAWLKEEKAKASTEASTAQFASNTEASTAQFASNTEASNPQLASSTEANNSQSASNDEAHNNHATANPTMLPEHPALARRLIRRVYQSVGGDTSNLTFQHIENIRNHWQTHGFATDLPGGISARNLYGKLHFITRQQSSSVFHQTLQKNQVLATSLGNIIFTDLKPELFMTDPVAYARHNANNNHLIVDTDLLDAYEKPLVVSSLLPETRFSPLGMTGKMKLVSDLLIDRKIPFYERNKLLMLSVGGDIIWVIGVQADDRFKVRPESVRLSSIMIASNNS
jgi:tRNA(Ile)-lysidine synthase